MCDNTETEGLESDVAAQIWSLRGVRKEVIDYARYLSMELPMDAPFLWIAEKGVEAKLPSGWEEHEDDQGHPYYHCTSTNETTWTHPRDVEFWQMYHDQRALRQAEAVSDARSPNPLPIRWESTALGRSAAVKKLEPLPPTTPRTASTSRDRIARRRKQRRPGTSRTTVNMNEHLSERPNTTPHISMTAREPGSSNRDLEKKWVPAGSNSSVYNPSLPKSNREWLAPYRGNHGKHTCRHVRHPNLICIGLPLHTRKHNAHLLIVKSKEPIHWRPSPLMSAVPTSPAGADARRSPGMA